MVLDAWESAKLKEFDQRVANGEKANKLFATAPPDFKALFNCGFNVAPNFLTILIASLFNKEISTVA
jgi:hypothetical protein